MGKGVGVGIWFLFFFDLESVLIFFLRIVIVSFKIYGNRWKEEFFEGFEIFRWVRFGG